MTDTKILPPKEAKKLKHSCFYKNEDYAYYLNGYAHFIRNGIDVLAGLNAVWYGAYTNGNIIYKKECGYQGGE